MCVKRLLVELHYTLHIKQTVIIFKLCIYDYAVKQHILGGFLKLISSNHPTVTTLRPAAADGIGTVMQRFESRLTRAASGRLLAGPNNTNNNSEVRQRTGRHHKTLQHRHLTGRAHSQSPSHQTLDLSRPLTHCDTHTHTVHAQLTTLSTYSQVLS